MRLSLIEGKLCFTRSERFVVFKAGNARRKKMEKRQITLLARAKMAMMLDRTCVLSSYTDERR